MNHVTTHERNEFEILDENGLRALIVEAQRKRRGDLCCAALRRIAEINGAADPLARDVDTMLLAYDVVLEEKLGSSGHARATRSRLEALGMETCLEQWALAASKTQGFALLIESGLGELTAEAVVLRHAHRFSSQVTSAAQARLRRHGVNVEGILGEPS